MSALTNAATVAVSDSSVISSTGGVIGAEIRADIGSANCVSDTTCLSSSGIFTLMPGSSLRRLFWFSAKIRAKNSAAAGVVCIVMLDSGWFACSTTVCSGACETAAVCAACAAICACNLSISCACACATAAACSLDLLRDCAST